MSKDAAERHIALVYSFANGMTMVFDQDGKQMPEFQGRTEEVAPKIEATGFTMPTGQWKLKWPAE